MLRAVLSTALAAALGFSGLTAATPAAAGHDSYGSVHVRVGHGHRGPPHFAPPPFRHHYGKPHHRHHHKHRHHHHRHHGGDATAALLGVGVGLMLYHAFDEARDRNDYYYDDPYPRRTYRYAEPPRYAPRPGPAPRRTDYYDAPAYAGGECLQTREYQTTVIVGGVERDAYGTACLQPDGSWLKGPVQVAPGY